MKKPRVGIVGLGEIAQKAYLPILLNQTDWTLQGAFSPTKQKRDDICKRFRMQSFDFLLSLAEEIDVAFVHSSTESHYQVVSQLLMKGIDVYVDKPLAATLDQAEKLAELSIKTNRKLMVGFNRRFAPLYIRAKELAKNTAWIRIEKHRSNRVHPISFDQTLLDDYIHLVDLARWVSEQEPVIIGGNLSLNEQNHLLFTHHSFQAGSNQQIFTGMHRMAGTNMERVEWVSEGRMIRVMDLEVLEIEEDGRVITERPSSWETILHRRGFQGAVDHFMECVAGDDQPAIDAEEALKTQHLLTRIIHDAAK